MKTVSKCANCGAKLECDENASVAICPYCNSEFVNDSPQQKVETPEPQVITVEKVVEKVVEKKKKTPRFHIIWFMILFAILPPFAIVYLISYIVKCFTK